MYCIGFVYIHESIANPEAAAADAGEKVAAWESMKTHNAAVPRRYMQLIWLYAALSQARAAELETKEKRLAGGVGKLQEAKRLVDQLKQSAAQKSEELARAQESADQVLQQIANSMSV